LVFVSISTLVKIAVCFSFDGGLLFIKKSVIARASFAGSLSSCPSIVSKESLPS
jgi:hypothetical protein